MTEMCYPCPRTPVTHVPSLYRSKLGHPAAHPKRVLVHRIEEARQVANRKRDDRQKRCSSSPHPGRCTEMNAVGPNGFPGRLQITNSFNNLLDIPYSYCFGFF